MTTQRPDLWVGHVSMRSKSLDETEAFMIKIGLRSIFRGDSVAVLELRGGTHLVVAQDGDSSPGDVDFDLMVEDLNATHADFNERGFQVTGIEKGSIHNSFFVTEPGGNRIKFNSTHVPDHTAV